MHSPGRHRALRRIADIRAAERTAARHELFLAGERERQAGEEERRADARTQEAAQSWRDHVAGAAFQPEFAHALAVHVIECADAGAAAQTRARQAADDLETSEDAWRLGDARCRQAERSVDASRRAAARDRDERALEIVSDGVTFAWRQR